MFIWFRLKAENYFYIKDGEIVGILSLGTDRGDQIFIYTIAVEPTFRKQGIGKALMTFSEERAAELKKNYMALVVMSRNIPAVSLYKKYGYSIVGEGTTYLSLAADKIQFDKTHSLELRKFDINNGDLLSILKQFILGEIEIISGKDGLEYFEKIRFPEYYPGIKKSIQKGKRFMYSIYKNDNLVGFLLFSDNKNTRNVVLYSQADIWNIDFLNNISDSLGKLPSSSGKINKLKFKLSISKVERIENLDQTDFDWDIATNKLLMFRKL